MSWLAEAPGDTPLERVLGWNPDLLDKFKRFYARLWDERLIEPELLELLRLRVAQLHGCEAELAVRHEGADVPTGKLAALAGWRASDAFSERERALLDYAEGIPFRHQFIASEQVAAVKRHLDDRAFVSFTLAVTMFDALCRLRMTFGLVATAAVVPHPAVGAPLH